MTTENIYDHNSELELLKLYMQKPDNLEKSTLNADDFHLCKHQIIFDCMKYLRNALDMESLKTELEKRKQVDAVDGLYFITVLAANDTILNSAQYNEAKIKDLSDRRKLVDKLQKQYTEIIDLQKDYRNGTDSGIFTPFDMSDKVFDYWEKGDKERHTTGEPELDAHLTFGKWEFYIVTGIPSHGKSEFIDWLIVNQMRIYNDKVAIFSPENYPIQKHISKMLEKITGKPFHRGHNERISEQELSNGLAYLSEHAYFIYPEESELSLDYVLEKFKICKAKYGVNGVIIDPFNELDWNCPPGANQSEYVGQCLTRMRRFARVHDCYFILVAHPTKMQKNADGEYDPPRLYDISGSANFYNKADWGITVYRDVENNGPTQIHISKVRFKGAGKVGMVELAYNTITGNYYYKAKF